MDYPYPSPDGDEEALNQQVIGHLHYSLSLDSSLLNIALQDIPISFDDDASVVAHQYSPLPHTAKTEVDREIDWVIEDGTKLVGFESKYGDTLSKSQLNDELLKLEANAGDKAVHLVTITHHGTRPSLIDRVAEGSISWTNWISVADNLYHADTDQIAPEQQIPLKMLNDLFEAENMEPFTGFSHQDKEQYRYFIRDIRPGLNEIGLENRGKLHNWTSTRSNPTDWRRIIPRYIDIPFVDEDRPKHNESGRPKSKRASRFAVVIDTERNRVHAGISFQTNKVDSHRKMIQDNKSELIAYTNEQGFEMWISRNSLNQRNVRPKKTDDPEQMQEWLSTSGESLLPNEDGKYIRVMLIRDCTEPDPGVMFETIVDTLADLRSTFLDEDEFLDQTTLVKPATST